MAPNVLVLRTIDAESFAIAYDDFLRYDKRRLLEF